MRHASIQPTFENSVSYLHGRIEAQLEAFARSLDIPAVQLTSRVGALLLGVPSGSVLRPENSVPTLRRRSTRARKVKSKVAVASRASGATSEIKTATWKKPNNGVKAYWAKLTPEQRSKEMARRVAKRKLGKKSLVTQTREMREKREGRS